MHNKKRLLSGLLILLYITSVCSSSSGIFYYSSVDINGTRYKLSNPSQYYNPRAVEKQSKNIYDALAGFPHIKSYVYLVNSSRSIDVVRNVSEVPSVYTSILENFVQSKTDYLHFASQEDYAKYFYTTDHHWNYQGSYAGYSQIIQMMFGKDEPVLKPVESVTFPVTFNGSMNQQSGRTDSNEFFSVYRFAYPEMTVEINGNRKASYGNQESYFNGKFSKMPLANHYANFYGGDIGQLHLETTRTDRDNLIVFSNSFSNAIAMLLASHFHHTWFIDLRYYESNMGKPFNIVNAIEQWDIDRILILGDGDYFAHNHIYQKQKKR